MFIPCLETVWIADGYEDLNNLTNIFAKHEAWDVHFSFQNQDSLKTLEWAESN